MYYVYFLTNQSNTVLYIGVTNNLSRRLFEHEDEVFINSFTARYRLYKLVYYETTTDVKEAIEREKTLKKWSRKKKNDLVERVNPEWIDVRESLL